MLYHDEDKRRAWIARHRHSKILNKEGHPVIGHIMYHGIEMF